MYNYLFKPSAVDDLKKLPNNVQKRILKKLDYFCQDDPFVYANKLIDYRLGGYRFRVGDYRIIFDRRDENSIVILKIGHRKEIYK